MDEPKKYDGWKNSYLICQMIPFTWSFKTWLTMVDGARKQSVVPRVGVLTAKGTGTPSGVVKVFCIFIEMVVIFVIKLKNLHFIPCRIASINFISNKQNWMLSKTYYVVTRLQVTICKGTLTDISIILQIISIYLSCHKAHVIPASHFIQTLCNISLFIVEMVFIPSRLKGRSNTNTGS